MARGSASASGQTAFPLNARLQRLAFEQFHGEKLNGRAGIVVESVHAEIEDAAHIGVGTDFSRGLNLALKAAHDGGAGGLVGADGFERDGFVDQPVVGAIDLAHASAAEQGFNLITGGDQGAGRERGAELNGGLMQEIAHVFVLFEEFFNLGNQPGVAAAGLRKSRGGDLLDYSRWRTQTRSVMLSHRSGVMRDIRV